MAEKVECYRSHVRRSFGACVAAFDRRRWFAGALFVGLLALASLAGAPAARAGTVYPNDILQTLRTMGLDPVTDPVRRGDLYVLHALDPHGVEMRVVADADFGEILSIVPAPILSNAYLAPILTSLYVPRAYAGPRIIHVPEQSGGK